MNAYTFIVHFLIDHKGYTFRDNDTAYDQLVATCGGNADDPTEPFSRENYENWGARLHVQYHWRISPDDLREAHEAWRKTKGEVIAHGEVEVPSGETHVIAFELEDQKGNGKKLKGAVHVTRRGVSLSFEGYGDHTSADGYGQPVHVEFFRGSPRVIVWADINQEDPTNIIELDNAAEDKRTT